MDLRKLCRICFVDKADVDITEHRSSASPEHTILELIQAMFAKVGGQIYVSTSLKTSIFLRI